MQQPVNSSLTAPPSGSASQHVSSTPTIILFLLCGLPCAGKSSVAAHIAAHVQQYYRSSADGSVECVADVICHHVEYDVIYNQLLQQSSASSAPSHTLKVWHEARAAAARSVEQHVASIRQSITTSQQHAIHLVLLDDNFYYRGMREPYYKLAQEQQLGYVECHVQCQLAVIQQRYEARNSSASTRATSAHHAAHQHVTWSAIQRMAEVFDWRGVRATATVLSVNTTTGLNADDLASSIPYSQLSKSLQPPASVTPAPQQLTSNTDDKMRSQQLNRTNLVHQADLRMRHLISDEIRSLGSCDGQRKRQIVEMLNFVRKDVLSQLRNNRFHFDDDDEQRDKPLDETEQLRTTIDRVCRYFNEETVTCLLHCSSI